MRRRWGLASLLSMVVAVPAAFAQDADVAASVNPADDPAPSQVIGYGALPGGIWAPGAETLRKGAVSLATLGGFGQRSGLLGTDHSMTRMTGRFAIGFAPHEMISLALSLDGRFDSHSGLAADDDGYVGDPHLLVRVGKQQGNLRFGGGLDLWVPGKDAPSVAGSAISVAGSGLVALKAGPGWLSLSAGFRVDNSSKSVDKPVDLSVADRVSLGVSEFHAAVLGAHLGIPLANNKAFAGLEALADIYIGDGETPMGATMAHAAPSPMVRFGATAGYHISKTWTVLGYVGGARVPKITTANLVAGDISLVPYEPTFSVGLGLQGMFGGPAGPDMRNREKPEEITTNIIASVKGEILDDAGKPVVGAKVGLKTKSQEGTGVTDDKGVFVINDVRIGTKKGAVVTMDDPAAEVSVDVNGKKPAKKTFTIKEGENIVERITLDPVLPPGQLRAVVRSVVTGKPVAGATAKVEPGGLTATSAADGTFSIDLQPGDYVVTVSAPDLKPQEVPVKIDPNGVAIKNIELAKP